MKQSAYAKIQYIIDGNIIHNYSNNDVTVN